MIWIVLHSAKEISKQKQSILNKIKVENIMIAGEFAINKMINLNGCALADLKSIFSKHGTTIERITLKNCYINIADLLQLLNFTPNAHSLEFVTVIASYSNSSFPKLQNVKSLSILYCNSTLQVIASAVAEGALESFSFTADHFYAIDLFLKRQKNITNMSLHSLKYNNAIIQAQNFKYHKLNGLSLLPGGFGEKLDALNIIIKQQAPYLKSLDLSGFFVENKTLDCITQLPHLENLAVNINRISPTKMIRLQNLQQLKELTIIMNANIDKDKHFICFSQINFKKLTKLEIKFPMIKLEPITFVRLGLNLQSLKHLYIDCDLNFDVIAAISSNMFGLETLVLHDVKELATTKVLKFNDFNNLRKLSLFVDISLSSLATILYINFPILQFLEIQSKDNASNIGTIIQEILHNFANLKELKVDNKNSIDLNCEFVELLQLGTIGLHLISFYVTNSLEKTKKLLGVSNKISLEGERLTLEFNF